MNDIDYVVAQCAEEFVKTLPDNSVHLLAIDPPYFHIVAETWDYRWSDTMEYARWLFNIICSFYPKLTHDASVVFFGAIGKRGERPLFEVMRLLDGPDSPYFYRNLITWQKRRAYGKSHDYLFCREEIAWYSCASARTVVRFNIPLTSEKRGYAGFNPRYPAKSEYKRVSNVWTDIPELMRPERPCQKPVELMRRIVETHSNQGDLVVDCFAGYGTTGLACAETGRLFRGCEGVPRDAYEADVRMRVAFGLPRVRE